MPADVFEVYFLLIYIELSIYFACLKLLALSYVEIRLIIANLLHFLACLLPSRLESLKLIPICLTSRLYIQIVPTRTVGEMS